MTFTTRFAPSPTGPLHLGHAYSAMLAFDMARRAKGQFLLRIEDIDRSRARREWEDLIYEDLAWLGLSWPKPVMRQSDQQHRYEAALDALWSRGLLYPCTCSRADIAAAASAPQEGAPLHGPDGVIYPGTCRPAVPPSGPRPSDVPLRLDIGRACSTLGDGFPLGFREEGDGDARDVCITATHLERDVGDIVLSRRDMGTSYHLSVVLDDAAQGISDVVRGRDLFDATAIHVLLQKLMDLPVPRYHHHRLIRDAEGKRLAKRDDARAIRLFRQDGASPADLRAMVGL
ncbi:tRNA glutamyl-Q(34) synthetase GluQRS [Sulfitobacter sp. HNIBRBA3233]|uniref:tRNA glutamyl-Q(34) synthetase GluQRS n=1 Tax=Sulfitobacter marinivivus TaxID=3158558 RepID=UPI0032DEA3BC